MRRAAVQRALLRPTVPTGLRFGAFGLPPRIMSRLQCIQPIGSGQRRAIDTIRTQRVIGQPARRIRRPSAAYRECLPTCSRRSLQRLALPCATAAPVGPPNCRRPRHAERPRLCAGRQGAHGTNQQPWCISCMAPVACCTEHGARCTVRGARCALRVVRCLSLSHCGALDRTAPHRRPPCYCPSRAARSEEHTSELQSPQ